MTKHEKVEVPVTASELRLKRVAAGCQLLFRHIAKADDGDRTLYAMNLRGDLTEEDRLRLLSVILDTFPPDLAERACQGWFEGAGYPGAAMMDNPVSDARFWADSANSKEIDAYAMACVKRMSPKRRGQFAEWVKKQTEGDG